MRVLVICSKFPPARAPESAHALFLCQHLAECGIDVHLITSDAPPPLKDSRFEVRGVMSSWGWRALPKLARHIQAIRPDVILLIYVGWIYGFQPMITYLPALCRLLVPHARFVTQFENVQLITNRTNRWSRLLGHIVSGLPRSTGVDPILGTLMSHSWRIIVLTDAHLEQLRSLWHKVDSKSVLIPAPPLMKILDDPDGSVRAQGRTRLKVAANELLLVHYGYLYRSKGVETLLRALAGLRDEHPDLRLALVGAVSNDYGDELHRLAAELGLGRELEWVGHCEPDADDGSILIHAADVLVLPFDSGIRLNNSSFAVGAAHGVPIVTTEGADLEAPFRHGENVWLCKPRDPAALMEAIRTLALNASLRVKLGAGARRLAEEVFSWQRNIAATLEIIGTADRR